ncbi:hypothetical protein GCM10020331_006390 [Ectobacillus funiculus]
MCSRKAFVEERELEDNAFVIMNLKSGAQATMWASAINCGSLHGQKSVLSAQRLPSNGGMSIRTSWHMRLKVNRPVFLERGAAYLYPEALAEDRISAGHPEGLFDAWSNLYRRFAIAMDLANKGEKKQISGSQTSMQEHKGLSGSKKMRRICRSRRHLD